jgi:hypothetical protein
LPATLILAKCVPLLEYGSKCGTRENDRHWPSFDRRWAVLFSLTPGVSSGVVLKVARETMAGYSGQASTSATPHQAPENGVSLVGYPSGQRGQTVNLLAYAFDGSNPSPTTTPFYEVKRALLLYFQRFTRQHYV